MKKVKLICKKCGYIFVKEVFEKGEAEEKRVRHYPIVCPKCSGPVDKCI